MIRPAGDCVALMDPTKGFPPPQVFKYLINFLLLLALSILCLFGAGSRPDRFIVRSCSAIYHYFYCVCGRMCSLTCRHLDLSKRGIGAVCSGKSTSFHNGILACRRTRSVRCKVLSVQNVGDRSSGLATDLWVSGDGRSSISISDLLEVVVNDLQNLNRNLKSIVGAENPVLVSAAEQIFGAGGKRLRPALVFLASRATAEIAGLKELTTQHQRLAEIIEMIHTASLIHDDVLDDSGMRRGKQTVHQIYGTRVAVLAGDFMFAQSSWHLANLENLEVIKLISQVIKDFASGEIKQASSLFDCSLTLEDYLLKSFHKTASLVAASTKAAAIFSRVSISVSEQMYEYGRNLGLSFQVVDDVLDFTQSSEQLGKPAGTDLAKGNLTAPVIFALEKEPRLREIIGSGFRDEGSLDRAVELVLKSGGIGRAQALAKEKAELAMKNLHCLPQSIYRSTLEGIVKYNLERID